MIRRLRALALGQVTSEGEEKKDEEGGPSGESPRRPPKSSRRTAVKTPFRHLEHTTTYTPDHGKLAADPMKKFRHGKKRAVHVVVIKEAFHDASPHLKATRGLLLPTKPHRGGRLRRRLGESVAVLTVKLAACQVDEHQARLLAGSLASK